MQQKLKKNEAESAVSDILSRGVGEFIDPGNAFREKLTKKAMGEYDGDIIVKFGVDPTRPDIHLGHAVVLHKLRKMQDLGCKVVFLIGDFTAQIGDPTGKSKTRPQVEQKAVEENMKTYLEQAGKVLRKDEEVFTWIRNSDWLTGVTDINIEMEAGKGLLWNVQDNTGVERAIPITDPNSFVGKALMFDRTRMQTSVLHRRAAHVITLATLFAVLRKITYAQLIERDLFQDRIKNKEGFFMHEMLYPVVQGVDSNVIARIWGSCDLEIGGTDQTFNMLMGRTTMEIGELPPQSVMGVRLLVGTDGKEKMSKSLENYIGVTDPPGEMFGKIMSLPDQLIADYFELGTYMPQHEIAETRKKIDDGKVNPRDLKMELGEQVVAIYHGAAAARDAREGFIATFKNKELPKDIEAKRVKKGTLLADALVVHGIAPSKTEARRLIVDGAVRREGEEKVEDPKHMIERETLYKIGKHRFVRFTPE